MAVCACAQTPLKIQQTISGHHATHAMIIQFRVLDSLLGTGIIKLHSLALKEFSAFHEPHSSGEKSTVSQTLKIKSDNNSVKKTWQYMRIAHKSH